jgi:ADP-dependent phosphofructokinase/glucokinase
MMCAIAPVLVCQHPIRTVGLGDIISSSALVAQLP